MSIGSGTCSQTGDIDTKSLWAVVCFHLDFLSSSFSAASLIKFLVRDSRSPSDSLVFSGSSGES